ncbi:MAG: DUF2301 domain-containing membrane protein [Leptolyngbyaceae cyanobacterium T60_A2020_046]|nr:DUF2301 domain-containing membrane protein [Leptolyngbyaceae cyanobacterium T60_A2020_046]
MTSAAPSPAEPTEPVVYEGQFGPFTIEAEDRRDVILYRIGLAIAALSFVAGLLLFLNGGDAAWSLHGLSACYGTLWLGLGLSLWKIHIYLKPLHRLLQGFWLVGGVASFAIAHHFPEPFAQTVYEHPATLWGVGFTFAALTGIYFKEAFCFNRLETKLLTPLVPFLLLGHLFGWWSDDLKLVMLGLWAIAFGIFALRKGIQPIPPDIGDKSVFAYLAEQRHTTAH